MIRDTYMSPSVTFIFDLDPDYGAWCIVRGRHRIRDGKIPDDLLSVFSKPPQIDYESVPDEPWNEAEQNPGHETILSGENVKPIRWYSEKDLGYLTGDWTPKYDVNALPAGLKHFMAYLEKFEVQCLLNKMSGNDWKELAEAYRNAGTASPEQGNLHVTPPSSLNLSSEELCSKDGHHILPDERYDPYELIHSKELRDYYRRTELFGTEEVRDLIIKSYIPLQQKLDMLLWLRGKSTDADCKKCNLDAMIHLYSVVIEMLTNPDQKALYIVCSDACQGSDYGCKDSFRMLDINYGSTGECFDSYEEMMTTIQKNADEARGKTGYEHADVTQILWDEEGKNWSPASYQMECIDGEIAITDFHTEKDEKHCWLMNPKFTDDLLMDQFNADSIRYYPFPYAYGSRVSIQTPIMEKPITGYLGGGLDGLSCAYHFLYVNGQEDFIDLSYHVLNYSGYSVWDWIRSADNE